MELPEPNAQLSPWGSHPRALAMSVVRGVGRGHGIQHQEHHRGLRHRGGECRGARLGRAGVLSRRDSGHAAPARSALRILRSRPVRATQEDADIHRQRVSAAWFRCFPAASSCCRALPGTPSAKSGMAPGDEILAVNGYRLSRLDMDQLVALLTQSRQQQAQLVVRRPGNARFLSFVLTPEEMQSPSVERAFFLKPGIGYLRVASFDEKTGQADPRRHREAGRAQPKGAGARPAQESRRAGDRRAGDGRLVPQAGLRDRDGARPRMCAEKSEDVPDRRHSLRVSRWRCW